MMGIMTSCEKESVPVPEFNVEVNSKQYYAGDTVFFRLTGNPDIISFYSGEPNRIYQSEGSYSTPIKAVSDVAPKSYFYIYNASGTYTATFMAANSNIYDRKEITRQIEINIETRN